MFESSVILQGSKKKKKKKKNKRKKQKKKKASHEKKESRLRNACRPLWPAGRTFGEIKIGE